MSNGTSVRVFSFWTGPQSPLIRLCLRSLERNCPDSECWTLEQWQAAYDGSLGPWAAIAKQRPNVQSDILRAWLLHTYGGIWIDADCIIFRDLRPLWQHIEAGADLVTYKVRGNYLCPALLAGNPSSKILDMQCRKIATALRPGRRLTTMALGPKLLRKSLNLTPEATCVTIPQDLIHPLPWWTHAGNQRRFLNDQKAYQFHESAYGFMLTHRAVMRVWRLREKQLLQSSLIVGQALRRAFQCEF